MFIEILLYNIIYAGEKIEESQLPVLIYIFGEK